MARKHWSDRLNDLAPYRSDCPKVIAWARTQPSLAVAWSKCERADWMVEIAARTIRLQGSVAHRALVLALCACARRALPYVRSYDKTESAVCTTEEWARRKASIEQVQGAYETATESYLDAKSTYDYTYAAADYTVVYATSAGAAVAFYAISSNVTYATSVVCAVAFASDPSSHRRALSRMAVLIREHIPPPSLSTRLTQGS